MWIKYVISTLLLASVISCLPSSVSTERGMRVINADKYNHPFLVSIQIGDVHQCTGTIIAPTWILTAAACARKDPFFATTIEYGVPTIEKSYDNVVQIKARYFSDKESGFDYPHIALIQLREPLTYNKYVAPVVLPKEDIDLAAEFTELVGWMFNTSEYKWKAHPKAIDLRVQSNEECAGRLGSIGSIGNTSVNICTTYEYNEDAQKLYPCLASFSPLMYGKIQVGIAVQLPGTHRCHLPSFHIKISHYTKWILSTMDRFGNFIHNDIWIWN